MQRLIIAIVVLLFVFVGNGYSNTLVVDEQGDIFAETDRYQVRFRNGSVIHVHNKLTQETYTRQGRETATEELHHVGFNHRRIARADFLEVKKVAPLAAKLTAVWHERHQKTLIMWVSIDAFTGDLIIKQEGFDPKGSELIGWGFGNLDHNQVSVILPVHGGLLINADSPQHLSYNSPDRGWQARLALLQGHAGGCSVMSTDETYRFDKFNYTRHPDAFEVGFITEAFLPPEDHPEYYQRFTSTTWRLNTYSGDWQVPAEKYRQDMIQRNAARVVPPPAWVKDIQLVIMYCSQHRPQHILRMFDFIAKQIDPKNVLFYCRGGWGTGEEVAAPDHRVRKDLPIFMSAAKRHGFRVMLYSGFLYVDQDHPLYPEWEAFLYRRNGGIMGWQLDQGGPAIINPAYSGYREYKVQVLKNLQSTYNIDGFMFDYNTFTPNQKLIDGLTSVEGNMLLHEELIAAMPEAVFGGEGVSEITAPYTPFYSRGDDPDYTHPITDFLFSQWTQSFGGPLTYLEGARYIELENKIMNVHTNLYKHQDVIPTIRYHYSEHFEIQNAISILHRTNSNVEFWEELERMVNSPYREDLNFDGVVNILDLVIVANAIGDPIGPDLNGDDVVNILDLVIVANAFN
ncbi:MAG: hypothetical protein OXI67_21510 [Candidatus Poribacteria bacterium]|nr:hypothetical protein [Candidatus Poribacteria bacterium]